MAKIRKKQGFKGLALLLAVAAGAYIWFVALPRRFNLKLEPERAQLSSIGRLALLEQRFRDVIYIQNTEQFFGISLKGSKTLFAVDYILRAGINLEENFELSWKKGALHVALAAPQIFSIDADDKSIEAFFNKNAFGRPLKTKDFLPVLVSEKAYIARLAEENDWQSQTVAKAKVFFTTYFKGLGYETVRFSFASSSSLKKEPL